MRTNSRITFVSGGQLEYDFELGDYVVKDSKRETRPCHLSTLGVDRSFQIFGDYNAEVLIARLIHPFNKPFDLIEVNGEPYKWTRSRHDKKVFYITKDSVIEDGQK